MTQRSYPFTKNPDGSDGTTTDAEFSAMFGMVFPSGVDGFYKSGSLLVSADSSGMTVKVAAGRALVDGHYYSSSEQEPLPIDANLNSGGATRVDTIVIHKEYGTVNNAFLKVVSGDPGGGAPTLTQNPQGTFEFPLADVNVPSGAVTIAPSQVIDRRVWWGIEFMRRFGLVIGPTAPDPKTAFLFVKTA